MLCQHRKLRVRLGPKVATVIIRDVFEFEYINVDIMEILEIDLAKMVFHKAKNAYKEVQLPCIVEHAGLIFKDRRKQQYPGGLTQPMWDSLTPEGFLKETNAPGREAIARAVIGYCDGKSVKVFTGDTNGVIADSPRGKRGFYWDTVFIPKSTTSNPTNLTYAEICDDPRLGVKHKVLKFSQSGRALDKFLKYRLKVGEPELFEDY